MNSLSYFQTLNCSTHVHQLLFFANILKFEQVFIYFHWIFVRNRLLFQRFNLAIVLSWKTLCFEVVWHLSNHMLCIKALFRTGYWHFNNIFLYASKSSVFCFHEFIFVKDRDLILREIRRWIDYYYISSF